MPWNKVTLSSEDLATGKGLRLQRDFGRIWFALLAPSAAAVYDSKKLGKEGSHVYFTPHAVEIAGPLLKQYGAVECAPPNVSELDVLVLKKMPD
jgi:hypothetical protein